MNTAEKACVSLLNNNTQLAPNASFIFLVSTNQGIAEPRTRSSDHSLSRVVRPATLHLSSNGDLDLDTSVNVDNDLLDDLGGGGQVDEALVDAHLEAVPGLGALTARGLAGGDLEGLGGQADGALEAEVLALGAVEDLLRDLLEGLHLAGGEGDADLVGLGGITALVLLALLVGRHDV